MKFKLIFALFNGIVVISFLFVFLMPLFVLGFDYTTGFWSQNWYLILVFAGILGLLDAYFIINWRMFQLLEKEDWKSLAELLEVRVFQKNRFSEQSIRLLCNAWVVQGKPLEILRLESHLRQNKPSLIARHGLLLGIPYLLKNETGPLLGFFEPLAKSTKAIDYEWIRFNLAFGLLAERRVAEAVTILDALCIQRKEPIVQLLALYLLDSNTPAADQEKAKLLGDTRAAFVRRFERNAFFRMVDKHKENLEVIILSKFINEAAEWLYSGPSVAVAANSEAKA